MVMVLNEAKLVVSEGEDKLSSITFLTLSFTVFKRAIVDVTISVIFGVFGF